MCVGAIFVIKCLSPNAILTAIKKTPVGVFGWQEKLQIKVA